MLPPGARRSVRRSLGDGRATTSQAPTVCPAPVWWWWLTREGQAARLPLGKETSRDTQHGTCQVNGRRESSRTRPPGLTSGPALCLLCSLGSTYFLSVPQLSQLQNELNCETEMRPCVSQTPCFADQEVLEVPRESRCPGGQVPLHRPKEGQAAGCLPAPVPRPGCCPWACAGPRLGMVHLGGQGGHILFLNLLTRTSFSQAGQQGREGLCPILSVLCSPS